MPATRTWMTADELLQLRDDDHRHELVEGELRTMTPAGGEHGIIAATVAHLVRSHVVAHRLGLVFGAETGFRIGSDPDTVRAPDMAYVRRERVPAEGIPRGYWPGAPDLAAEVVSPGDTYAEVEEKVRSWLRAGTRTVWVINPRSRTVAVHTAGEGVTILEDTDRLSGGEVLPGWTCGVAELFPEAQGG